MAVNIKFGTGGWRAIIGDEFIKSNINLLAQAVAEDMTAKGFEKTGIVIGYDRRFLSRTAAGWVSEVMAGNGVKVFLIDRISPTPLIMYTVKNMGVEYGMAITASHNPAEYNGIKMFTKGGKDASYETTSNIENIIESIGSDDVKSMDFEEGIDSGIIQRTDMFNDYIDSILSMLNVEAIKDRHLKILLDPMYGVSKTSLQTVLMTARCEVDIIHDGHDALFGGRLPAPAEETLKHMSAMVYEKHYDLGIATDGDADRVGIVDDTGHYIHPNEIMILLYYYLLKYKNWRGPVVRNIATTHILDRIAVKYGQICYEVPVGFKHISSKLEETDALIGGESSGGLTIRGHIKGKDGIFASGLLVEMLCVMGKKLSEVLEEIYAEFGKLEMTESNIRLHEKVKPYLMRILFEEKKLPDFGDAIRKVSYEDGVKVYFENDGWIICRFSGTEPLLRIFCEMPCREEAIKITGIMKDFLNL